jgi:hypothetical protein
MDSNLVEIWKQLNDEMRHRDTMFTQLVVSLFVFLGAAGALMYYIPSLRLWVWISGFFVLIAGWIYVWMIAKGQKICYEAALEVQRGFQLSEDIARKLKRLMDERKQRFSSLEAQIILAILTIGLWTCMGLIVVFHRLMTQS